MNRKAPSAMQTDAEFLSKLHVQSSEEPLALAMREVLSEWCDLSRGLVRSDSDPEQLAVRMKAGWSRGWDEAGFLMKLEDKLGLTIDTDVHLPPFVERRFLRWGTGGARSIAAWIKKAILCLPSELK